MPFRSADSIVCQSDLRSQAEFRGDGCCAACASLGGAHSPPDASAGELLQMLDGARSSWTPANRATLLEIPLLAAFYDCITGAIKTLVDVASDEGTPETAIHIRTLGSSFAHLFGDDAEALHDAWDTASVCPFGLGSPPLSSIRTDLPLQRGYRHLPARARITLLAFAAHAGHSAVMLNAGVLAQRTGLAVSDVHLGLHELFASHWLECQ